MQVYSQFSRVQRNSDFGIFLREVLTNAMGTIEVPKFSAVRVRATGATTVTFDGVLSCTMSSGEILVLNAGPGLSSDVKETVTLVIAGAAAYVQLGIELKSQFDPNP